MRNPIRSASLILAVAAMLLVAVGSHAESHRFQVSADGTSVQLNGGDEGKVLRHLSLELGKSILLQTDYAVKRVSIANPDIADFVVLGSREINLVPKEIGETNVILWDRNERAQSVIELVVGRPHAGVESTLRSVMGSDDIRVRSVGDSIVLKGSVEGAADVDRALRVAAALFPDEQDEGRIINLLQIGSTQQVMIEVSIAEMSREFTREMESNFAIQSMRGDTGISFFNFLEGMTSVNASGVSTFTDRVNLIGQIVDGNEATYSFFLNFLKRQGLAKILAEPTVVARSGQSANFLVGGEVPIPVAQGGIGGFGSITIEYKEFGIGVEFTPTVMDQNRIHIEVTPEVSEPDFTLGTTVSGNLVPGFRTRRSSTGVELGDGQAFAIAGLLSDDIRELSSSYPVLGDIPILGALFRSKQYQKRSTELVMIVRPRLVKPMDGEKPRLPTDNFIEPSDYEFYLTNALEGAATGTTRSADAGASGGLFGSKGHRVSIVEAEKELQ